MSSIIKQYQYNGVLPDPHGQNAPETSARGGTAKENEQSQTKQAFQKAKKIVDAANQYSAIRLKEMNERITQESLSIREQSRADGFEAGYSDGSEQGTREGYTAGYEEGMRVALQNNEETKQNLLQVLKSLEDARTELLDQQKDQMIDLALELAQTILQEEVTVNPNAVTSIATATLEKYKNEDWINIHISQKVYDALVALDPNLLEQIQSYAKGAHMKPNPELQALDCLIELPGQLLDASADTQMRKIKAVLRQT